MWQWHEWHGSRDPDTASLVGFHRIDRLRSLAGATGLSLRHIAGLASRDELRGLFNPSGRLGVRAASALRGTRCWSCGPGVRRV